MVATERYVFSDTHGWCRGQFQVVSTEREHLAGTYIISSATSAVKGLRRVGQAFGAALSINSKGVALEESTVPFDRRAIRLRAWRLSRELSMQQRHSRGEKAGVWALNTVPFTYPRSSSDTTVRVEVGP